MSVGIDFTRIREYLHSQRTAFEELVCQLARREPPANSVDFRRVEGAGGDGGAEAYWVHSDGGETGYQAKYFTKPGDINWKQVDDSVRTALECHPNLRRYYVAFACDFTDTTTKQRDSAQRKWNEHRQKWETWAQEKGMTVEFNAWTRSLLVDRLQQPACAGIREYWFNLPAYTPEWFSSHFSGVVADLEERYSPEDHVDLSSALVLDGLLATDRFAFAITEVAEALDTQDLRRALKRANVLNEEHWAKLDAIDSLQQMLAAATAAVKAIPLPDWQRRTAETADALFELWKAIDSATVAHRGTEDATQWNIQEVRRQAYKLQESLLHLQNFVESQALQANFTRCLLLIGEAGSGKSHMLADRMSHVLAQDKPGVMILGQHLTSIAPTYAILQRLDIAPSITFDTLIQTLGIAGEANDCRILFVIDAINEALDLKCLRSHFLSLVNQLLVEKNICLAISCRPEYYEYFKLGTFTDRVAELQCAGFSTADEEEAAAQQYIEKRGLTRPAIPWLAPEFRNPLFLRICCTALSKSGQKTFPKGLRGTTAIFRFYLQKIQGRLLGDLHELSQDALISAVNAIAKLMAVNRKDFVERGAIETAFLNRLGSAPAGMNWVDKLSSEGVFRKDHDFSGNDDALSECVEICRFSFQRFSDHLITSALLDDILDIKQAFFVGGKLRFLIERDGLSYPFGSLLIAMATQIPERYGLELPDIIYTGGNFAIHSRLMRAFAESLRWRSSSAFTERTIELFGESRTNEIELLLEFGALPEHPWNADFFTTDCSQR